MVCRLDESASNQYLVFETLSYDWAARANKFALLQGACTTSQSRHFDDDYGSDATLPRVGVSGPGVCAKWAEE